MSKRTLSEEIGDQKKRGVLLVLTGPTGAGKDGLFSKLLEKDPGLTRVITTSSREKREGEAEGNPYSFISRDAFEAKIAQGDFFEWVEFRGALYGTQKKTIEDAFASGKDIIWHIDARGVKNIKAKVKELFPRSVFVFLTASTIEELERRVKKDEQEGVIHHRWNSSLVAWEIEQYDDCDYVVVNEEGALDKTVENVLAIMMAKRLEVFH